MLLNAEIIIFLGFFTDSKYFKVQVLIKIETF